MRLKSFFGILLCLVTLTVGSVPSVSAAALACPVGIAHKGNSYYGAPVENSMGAFNAAFSVGTEWVETDVHFTSDSVPVLMHDATVDATTNGTGAIANMTGAQFTSLLLDNGNGQHPPTLDQLLDLIKADPSHHLLLEIKARTMTTAQEQILLQKLEGMESKVHLMAFSDRFQFVQHLKAANPAFTISILGYDPISPSPAGIVSQDLEYTYITAARVANLHAQGLKVKAWTANNATAWNNLRNMGVDAIITNKVDDYLKWAKVTCPADPTDPTDPEPTAPTVSLSAPTAGSTLSGTRTISANASDEIGVESVQFQLDGVNLGEADTTAPYSIDWDTTTATDGAHSLRAIATNTSSLQTTSSEVAVNVKNTEDPAPPTPVVTEYVTNASFETDLTQWTGLWSSNSKNTRVAGGYAGGYSLRSVNNSSATAQHGFSSKPQVIDGTANVTTSGKVYTASVWVKPDVAGQKINIYIREQNLGGSTVGSKTVTLTAKTTNWQQITTTYGAVGTGNKINFSVYAANSAANKGFNADLLSFTAEN